MHRVLGLLTVVFATTATAQTTEFTNLESFPHVRVVDTREVYVSDQEIGLDALQKRLGQWSFENSIRVSGQLKEVTYQTIDGYAAAALLKRQVEARQAYESVETLFECEGRDCGRAVQWASRVFGQRLLYGQDNDQRYWVGRSSSTTNALYVAYSAYRTQNRQYLVLQRYLLDQPDEP